MTGDHRPVRSRDTFRRLDCPLVAQDTDAQLQSLLPVLRCPRCGSTIERHAEGMLVCTVGHEHPVVGGIPRFTPASTYADSFGYQWTTFRTTQLDDANRAESEDTFAAKTGLRPDDVKGRSVLDVGCGMGRFADVVARWGASTVVGMDLSRAVESAAENLAPHDQAFVIQADAAHPPLQAESFDIVFSIGVLHHTPSTARSLAAVAPLVKPGGTLAVWLYWSRLRWTHAGSEILRPITSRMSEDRLLRMVRKVVPAADGVHRRFPFASKPLRVVLPTSSHPDAEWRILDTFDWYSPRFQWKHSEPEVRGWFEQAGFSDLWTGPIPVSVRGHKDEPDRLD